MTDWRRLPIRPNCEGIIGFSVPRDNEVLVISPAWAHLVRLQSGISATTDEESGKYDIYDPDQGAAIYRGKEYKIIGLYGGKPLLDSPQGERLLLNQRAKTISVTRDNKYEFTMKYTTSGGWAAATFSPDGQYIVLGGPSGFDFVVLERVTTITQKRQDAASTGQES